MAVDLVVHAELPLHTIPKQATHLAANPQLRVEGLVAAPQSFSPTDLEDLSRSSFTEDFRCEKDWVVPQQKWGGVRLADLLKLATPLPTARYVRVHAGNYIVPLALEEAEDALLADTLNDQPLTVEHGAPWRLAVAGAACHTSVKWVERLELSAEPGENVGARVAEARKRIHQAQTATSADNNTE